ncbi:MAG TPA: hypothetical protein VKE70_16635, partial [Candidatus Solibacter sp.]|nr:hypothetical protein [Candidatus Solibacter sp.]
SKAGFFLIVTSLQTLFQYLNGFVELADTQVDNTQVGVYQDRAHTSSEQVIEVAFGLGIFAHSERVLSPLEDFALDRLAAGRRSRKTPQEPSRSAPRLAFP